MAVLSPSTGLRLRTVSLCRSFSIRIADVLLALRSRRSELAHISVSRGSGDGNTASLWHCDQQAIFMVRQAARYRQQQQSSPTPVRALTLIRIGGLRKLCSAVVYFHPVQRDPMFASVQLWMCGGQNRGCAPRPEGQQRHGALWTDPRRVRFEASGFISNTTPATGRTPSHGCCYLRMYSP
ncbi:hypothetical protein PHLGIDRAFT_139300 [Phlebiopsis gigantea 11061_1 CR5-6]|uniref:Uncharacterized protein n=1 Tax=Phlebiopsis gigantea (strain 11061_1 CR5-6) TaxID=745531 RepID=A0A0C3SF03_PHLG1|nr:hypothetical protein PHLGIDRAFT_139300 [Phlebiopsis gigantea 11061_1 CR5-6]